MLTNENVVHLKETSEDVWMRELNSVEHLFWLADQHRSLHFAMVAEIDQCFPPDTWHAALRALQERHPLLSARLGENAQMQIGFIRAKTARIPLRVLERSDTSWQAQAERELCQPFDWKSAPLLRATLLQDSSGSTLILTAHHSLLDGMGSAYLIEDLLRLLSGERLPAVELAPTLDLLLEKDIASAEYPPEPILPAAPKAFRPGATESPEVTALAIPADLVRQLIDRARIEQTSVHGAVSAAVHEAARRLSHDWRGRPLRMLTPIDIRHLSGEVGTAPGAYVTQAVSVDDHPVGSSFWHCARNIKSQIAPTQERGGSLAALAHLNTVIATKPTVQHIAAFLSGVLAFDMVVSNLGNQPIPSAYNGVTLDALWGPVVSGGFADDQIIGVCTVDGVLRLTHTSYGALPGLLDEVLAVLEAAVIA
jgi:hypothetical protein